MRAFALEENMNDEMPQTTMTRAILRAALVCTVGFFWVALFWYQPATHWPIYKDIIRTSNGWLAELGFVRPWRWVVRSYLFVLVPIGVLWIFGRPPKALGLGKMATHGWRIVLLSFVVASPILIWLGTLPEMHKFYGHMFKPGGWRSITANALVIAVEHAYIEGIILSLALPGGQLHPKEDPPRKGRFAFLGLGVPEGESGALAWLGINKFIIPALVGQAILFGMVHSGKVSAELATSFPGGLGLGWLTYRIRSVWPSVILHIGTGAVILTTALIIISSK